MTSFRLCLVPISHFNQFQAAHAFDAPNELDDELNVRRSVWVSWAIDLWRASLTIDRLLNKINYSRAFDQMNGMNGLSALTGGFPNPHQQRPHSFNGALTPFGFPPMANMNRLMGAGNGMDGASFSSSSVSSSNNLLLWPVCAMDKWRRCTNRIDCCCWTFEANNRLPINSAILNKNAVRI